MNIIHDLPAIEYHDGSHIGSHAMLDADISPMLFHRNHISEDREPQKRKTCFDQGTGLHALVLEGEDAYDMSTFIGGPVNPKTGKTYGRDTKAFSEWAEQIPATCAIITTEEDEMIRGMANAIFCNPIASPLLTGGKPEVTIRGKWGIAPVQCRIDYLRDDLLIDVKSCKDLDSFYRDAINYNYHRQAAFYTELHSIATGTRLPFVFIACEKKYPFRVGAFYFCDEFISHASEQNKTTMGIICQCMENDIWPRGDFPDAVSIAMPRWMRE